MTEAKKLEQKFFRLVGKRAALLARLDKEINEVKAALTLVGCTHPEVDEIRWEHDNGYGRQTTLTGKQCKLCHKKNYYGPNSGWYSE